MDGDEASTTNDADVQPQTSEQQDQTTVAATSTDNGNDAQSTPQLADVEQTTATTNDPAETEPVESTDAVAAAADTNGASTPSTPDADSTAKTNATTAVLDAEDQFVVHVDESDTNLDYDLGDKPEERDAPTPTKDESMDVDAAEIVQSGAAGTTTATTDKQAEKSSTEESSSATATTQASKRLVSSSC